MASAFPTSVDNETALVDGTDKMRASTSINLAFLDITSTQTMIGASGAAQTHNTDIMTYLAYDTPPTLTYASSSTFTVSAGTIVVKNAGGSVKKLRRNTSSTTVDATNLDTGAMAAGYYYVYAIGDSTATTFTIKFSTTANAAPSGCTNYEMIGWFYNETGGVLDITTKFIGNVKRHGVPNKLVLTSSTDTSTSSTSFADGAPSIRFYSASKEVLMTVNSKVYFANASEYGAYCWSVDASDVSASERWVSAWASSSLGLSAKPFGVVLTHKATTSANTCSLIPRLKAGDGSYTAHMINAVIEIEEL